MSGTRFVANLHRVNTNQHIFKSPSECRGTSYWHCLVFCLMYRTTSLGPGKCSYLGEFAYTIKGYYSGCVKGKETPSLTRSGRRRGFPKLDIVFRLSLPVGNTFDMAVHHSITLCSPARPRIQSCQVLNDILALLLPSMTKVMLKMRCKGSTGKSASLFIISGARVPSTTL